MEVKKANPAVLAAIIGILASAPSVAARKPLQPHVSKLEEKGAGYSIQTDISGNYVIEYGGEGQPVRIDYPPPNQVILTVEATVSSDGKGEFRYQYVLSNAAESPQAVAAFVIEYQGVVFDLSAPARWEAGPISDTSSIMWDPYLQAADPGLEPGQKLAGVAMSAAVEPAVEKNSKAYGPKGNYRYQGSLPGIVDCHAQGPFQAIKFPEEPPEEIERLLPRFPFTGVGGRTLGPIALPAEGQIAWLIERLGAYIREGAELGWIEDDSDLNKYRQTVIQVARSTENHDPAAAIALLHAFRKQVAADFQRGRLTSEAHAILFYNGQFLESLIAPPVAFAERLPLAPHVAKIEVSDPRFTISTTASGDFVIRYKGQNGRPVELVDEPPSKVRMTVAAAVEADSDGNFTFRYELSGMPDSPQAAGVLVVEFQGAVVDVTSPSGWASKPLGFMSAISWRPGLEGPGVLPGSRLDGFALRASAKPVSNKFTLAGKERFFHFEGSLPGIVACHAGGVTQFLAFPDEPPYGLEDHFPFFPRDGVGGRTVGPVVLPVDGQIPWLLERLRSYAEESHELGWLEDSFRLQKYLQLLDQVGRQVENKSFLLGQQMLQAFRRQIELDYKLGFLTSESHALLVHNSSYLEKLLANAR